MTNAIRHILGVPIGIVVTPLAWYGMTEASQPLFSGVARVAPPTLTGTVLPLLVMLVIGVVLGLIAGAPLVSPVAALITGGVNLLFGLAYPLALLEIMGGLGWLPHGLVMLSATPAGAGTYLFIGVILLVSAAFPQRWRAPASAARPRPGMPPAGPPPYPYGGAAPAAPGPQGVPYGRDDVPGPSGPSGPQDAPYGRDDVPGPPGPATGGQPPAN